MSKLSKFYAQNLVSQTRMQKRVLLMVENEEDGIFWTDVFQKYAPNLPIKTKVPREHGSGKPILKKIQKALKSPSPYVLFGYDSDSDFFLNKDYLNEKYVFQTYAYSVENLRCIPQNLNRICQITTLSENLLLDFECFIKELSRIIYPMLLYILTEKNGEYKFLKDSFKALENIDFTENGQQIIEKYHEILAEKLPENANIELNQTQSKIRITPENAYLFFNGHTLEDIILNILDKVIKQTKRKEKQNKSKQECKEYYNKTKKYDISTLFCTNHTILLMNENCFLISYLKSDIENYANELPDNFLKYSIN